MKSDYSRNTFDPQKRYSRVLMQQGRVQIDADWNEQLDITGHRVGTEAIDVIGQTGAPKHAAAFGIVLDPTTLKPGEQTHVAALGLTPLGAGDFLLTPGRFYAGGTLCEADVFYSLAKQPDFPGSAAIRESGYHLVYLDVWQRHLTALDDDNIREKALGGPDTATRSKTIWQVKTVKVDAPTCVSDAADWTNIVKLKFSTGQLTARAEPGEITEKPCVLPPGAGYRRLENQLYRVEVHQAGARGTATFKWSRDNGTVVTRLAGSVNGKELRVEDLGRGEGLGFNPGDWVELLDDSNELNGTPGVMAQIETIERAARKVVFKNAPSGFTYVKAQNPKMRRWDDTDGERTVKAGAAADNGFLDLEDGLQVKFADGYYKSGDYWLIPARTAPNGIEWAADPATKDPLPQAPQGIAHTYCCLGWVTATKSGNLIMLSDPHDCRNIFPPLTEIDDDEEARKRHNRLLHGWGVVCGLQVHCGGDRQNVHIGPGYALECDGSEALLPPPGRIFGVVAAAKEADLLKGSTGKVALTMEMDANKQVIFGVRKREGEDEKWWQTILKGTLLMDFYRGCVDPLIQFVRKEFFINDPTDKRLVNDTVRRRTAALNLAVQFVNKSVGVHVLLSARDHEYLEKIYEDLKKFLDDPVYCGILDGLGKFPVYPFKEQGALTAFSKASMTEVRVSADGRAAYAFGGVGDAKVYVFDLAKTEMVSEIELKVVPGANALTVSDVAFFAKGNKIIVAANTGSDSVLYSYTVPKLGGAYDLIDEPVVIEDTLLVKLGQASPADNFMYGIAQGEGLVRFSPEDFDAGSFRAVLSFNATGHWLLGIGTKAGFLYAGAADGTAQTDRYTKVLVVSGLAEKPELTKTFELKAGGNDGFSVLFRASKTGAEGKRALATNWLYIAVEPAAGTTAKRLFVFAEGGDQIATFALPTEGPVTLAPTANHEFMMVALAEQYLLGWIDPAKNVWTAEQTLPTQMYPTALTTTAGKTPFVVVTNRDSLTLSLLPAELVSSKPTLTVADVVKYRAELIALYRALGLRLFQKLKDCFCEHLRVNCPVCTGEDVIELAAVDIREGKVYHICNSCRREVPTFPKVSYWLSLVPVISGLSFLIRELCCLVLPDVFKPAVGKDIISASLVLKMREQLTEERFAVIKKEALSRVGQLAGLFLDTTKQKAFAPFQKQVMMHSGDLVKENADLVKRRLLESGVKVNEVADYDIMVEKDGWSKINEMQFSYQSGDLVNLYTRDGQVVMITRATERSIEPTLGTTPELTKEIARLNAELTRMQDTHVAYVAAREKEISEMNSNLENIKTLLNKPASPARAPAAGRMKPMKPVG